MSAPESLSVEILVIGAGVLGLCTAVELTRRGHQVRVLDPGGVNASAVAAGMIAPALESAVDDVTCERAALLRRAGDLWPDFAEAHGLELLDDGAEWRGEGASAIAARLTALGFSPHQEGDRVFVAEDRRVDAEAALGALAAGMGDPPIPGEAASLTSEAGCWRVIHSVGVIEAQTVVLATGAAAGLPGLPEPVAAQVAAVTPIRGQIGRTTALQTPGVVRGRGAYTVTGRRRTLIGATMDEGRRDLEPDPDQGQALTAAICAITGTAISADDIEWRVGVRGATPDGLPLAGAAGAPGLFVALAPRRNGWLLGPLVGRIVADAIEGGAPMADAAALDPRRPL